MAAHEFNRRLLTIEDILSWATAHYEATGKWPTRNSGGVAAAKFETWHGINTALVIGLRGLPAGSSLAQLLAQKMGVRNIHGLAPLTETQILAWADEHLARTGLWPTAKSGLIPNSGGEKWSGIETALRNGARTLPGGSSIAKLLAIHRGKRNRKELPALSEEIILQWADAHYRRTGQWPSVSSGVVVDSPGETWAAVGLALSHGQRGMPGDSSLAFLLAERRQVRNIWTRQNFSIPQILAWADEYRKQTGRWPTIESGPLPDAGFGTWALVDGALRKGRRGLPGGSSLPKLLAVERGVPLGAAPLKEKTILAWADAHHRRTGQWPTRNSGTIMEAPSETWGAVDTALARGLRGLRAGCSLAQFLAQQRGKRVHVSLPPLSQKKILTWADAHYNRTGKWPNVASGPVDEAPEERWDLIDNALRAGHRGLAGNSSLLQLLVKKRGIRNVRDLPPLSVGQILEWANGHYTRTGAWPKYDSGVIAEAPGETWAAVDSALRLGKRGLPSHLSLHRLLVRERFKATGQLADV